MTFCEKLFLFTPFISEIFGLKLKYRSEIYKILNPGIFSNICVRNFTNVELQLTNQRLSEYIVEVVDTMTL